jgi:hypothetical protein
MLALFGHGPAIGFQTDVPSHRYRVNASPTSAYQVDGKCSAGGIAN